MAAVTSASLRVTLLSVVLSVSVSVSAGQTNITTEPGQTVSLPCKALNNDPVIVVEWRRTDLKEDEYVLFYRDEMIVTENQHPSYKNRVDLQDRQMKDGDVSLILMNVTTNGTYECYVETKTNHSTSIIRLDVFPAGHTDGHKEDRGDEPGHHQGHPGLIAGAVVGVVLIVAVSLITIRHMKKKSSPPSSSSSSSPPLQSADQPLV